MSFADFAYEFMEADEAQPTSAPRQTASAPTVKADHHQTGRYNQADHGNQADPAFNRCATSAFHNQTG